MTEMPQYVVMNPEEYRVHRANGYVSMGSYVDTYRQPGVVGLFNRKPVFLYLNAAEQASLEAGELEQFFVLRGYTRTAMGDEPPDGPSRTIP